MMRTTDTGSIGPRTNGGARAGAGRKPLGYEKPQNVKDYDDARARKESALADLHELDYKVKSGQYVPRAAIREASATAMAALAQTLRSLPDNLERRGISAAVCAQIDRVITESLADTARALERLHAGGPPDDNSDLF